MYTLTSDAKKVVRDSDGVVFNCIDGLTIYEEYKLWLAEGNVPNPIPRVEQFKAIERAFEAHMDSVANSKGYDNRDSCRLYAGYQNPFQAEAIAFGQWVANAWLIAFQQQAAIVAGTRPMPTIEEAVAEIPTITW